MKLASDGWLYEVPGETEFIEVTAVEGERAFVEFFDAAGEPMARAIGNLLSSAVPVQPWPKRLVGQTERRGRRSTA